MIKTNNKGITLVILIITIILMLILVSVTTYSGINSYKNMQVTKFVTQMQLIQTKINELVEEEKTDNLGIAITEIQKNILDLAYANSEVQSNTNEYKSNYIFFSRENLKEQLDLADIEDDVLVNFKTREVVSINGVEYEGKKYYTQYKLPNGESLINNETTTRTISFEVEVSVNGLNATATVNNISINNGTLSYSETDTEGNNIKWQTITNYTEKDETYTVNISKSGNYTFRLQDNTNLENSEQHAPIIITLTNKPKTNINIENYNYEADSNMWAYVEVNATSYVWIPRFAYNSNNDIKFIKGNSNIATDNTYIGDGWTIHSKFTDNETELTGIWIEKTKQQGLNMLELLNSDAQALKEINEQ